MSNSKIIFNLEYRCTQYATKRLKASEKKKQVNTNEMYDYYDRDEACDKTISTQDAFDYYDYRIGSEGGITNGGKTIGSVQAQKLCDQYRPEVIYRGVLSFDKDFAMEQGIIAKKNMEKLVSKSMNSMLYRLGLNPDNVIWTSFYHTNTQHPHCHISFYEKVPTRKGYLFKNLDKVRGSFISMMEINIPLYIRKDQSFNDLIQTISDIGIVNGKDWLLKASNNSNVQINGIKEIANKMIALDQALPKEGSMKYNSKNIRPYHNQIRDIINDIYKLETIAPFYAKYKAILDEIKDKQEEAYGTGDNEYHDESGNVKKGTASDKARQDEYHRKQMYRLETRIANMILQNIIKAREDGGISNGGNSVDFEIDEELLKSNETLLNDIHQSIGNTLSSEMNRIKLENESSEKDKKTQTSRSIKTGKVAKRKNFQQRVRIMQYGVMQELSQSIQTAYYANLKEKQKVQQAIWMAQQEAYSRSR